MASTTFESAVIISSDAEDEIVTAESFQAPPALRSAWSEENHDVARGATRNRPRDLESQTFRNSRPVVEIPVKVHDHSHVVVFDDSEEDALSQAGFSDESDGSFVRRTAKRATRNQISVSGPARAARVFDPALLRIEIMKGTFDHSQVASARSAKFDFSPPMPPKDESVAVKDLWSLYEQMDASVKLSESLDSQGADAEFAEFELSDFTIYLPDKKTSQHPWELRGLDHLTTRIGNSSFLFDGVLSVGDRKHYVQDVPFKICSTGNYGIENHDVGSEIWIQSDLNSTRKTELWYRLGSPSTDYSRFHRGFLWLANLAKHFTDYCEAKDDDVTVWDFECNFSRWIKDAHAESPEFNKWYSDFPGDDYRIPVSRNIHFLYKECIGVYDHLRTLSIWRELLELTAVPSQRIKEEKTIVTPYVYECFKDTHFGHLLKAVEPMGKVKASIQGGNLTEDKGLAQAISGTSLEEVIATSSKPSRNEGTSRAQLEVTASIERQAFIASIKPGDVLSVVKDGEGSLWKEEVTRWKAIDDSWLVYIQDIHISLKGNRSFSGLWLYRPCDTMCGQMKYPYPKELFLSNNTAKIEEDEILEKVAVHWYGSPTSPGFFVRQTYLDGERFVTLKEEHKTYKDSDADRVPDLLTQYPIGKTILATPQRKGKYELEAYEVFQHVPATLRDSTRYVIGRHLMRFNGNHTEGKANELVYTTRTEMIDITKINGPCSVRFYTKKDLLDDNIPAPYCRNGTANTFYITSRLVDTSTEPHLIPIHADLPISLIQGFDPTAGSSLPKLRGLDLYCGGGNFGRGLEEGGAVHNEWAVDLNPRAIHTYRANLKSPNDTKLFLGSVNDLLCEGMKGNPKNRDIIPMPGDVEFMSAGSPCQGFSTINSRKGNASGLRNQSLVASVASFIDFYRPHYGLLENVMGMAQKGMGRDKDILAQLICAIVGMGFQVQCFLLDAWSFGSPQGRTRLFVSFTAPGLTPQSHPRLSHAHPDDAKDRELGLMSNGESFGHRVRCKTFFETPVAGTNTADLPFIGDGATQQCTSHPDHIVTANQTQVLWGQIFHLPKFPRGLWLARAWDQGRGILSSEDRIKYWGHLIHNHQGGIRERFSPISKSYGRLDRGRAFPTIMTVPDTKDSRSGRILHWDEDRTISLLEARRAQGFPDNDILVGPPNDCWKIVGNSVARSMSLALGLSLREAWLQNSETPVSSSRAVAFERVNFEKKTSLPVSTQSIHLKHDSSRRSLRVSSSRNAGGLDKHRACLPANINSEHSHQHSLTPPGVRYLAGGSGGGGRYVDANGNQISVQSPSLKEIKAKSTAKSSASPRISTLKRRATEAERSVKPSDGHDVEEIDRSLVAKILPQSRALERLSASLESSQNSSKQTSASSETSLSGAEEAVSQGKLSTFKPTQTGPLKSASHQKEHRIHLSQRLAGNAALNESMFRKETGVIESSHLTEVTNVALIEDTLSKRPRSPDLQPPSHSFFRKRQR